MQKYRPGIILFIIFFITGLSCYKDYGISFDEPAQRKIGAVSYNYVFNRDNYLERFDNRSYGVGFELPLTMLEQALHLKHSREQYLMRHIVTHIFFLLGVFCGYVLVYRLFKSHSLACFAFLLLALHPRIYAQSYYNTKDIPFLAIVLMTLAMAQYAFEQNKPKYYLLLGIICGYGTSVRVMELLFVYIFCTFLVIDIISTVVKKEKLVPALKNTGVFIAGFVATIYAAWPFLWRKPIDNFLFAYNTFSGNNFGSVFFKGQHYLPGTVPGTYLPFWFATTMPVMWLIIGVLGAVLILALAIRNPVRYITNTRERNFGLYLATFAVPFGAIIIEHFNIYDDWRHLYFIYPSFVLMAIFALHELSKLKLKPVAYSLIIAQCAWVLLFMVRNHPFQFAYFNEFVSHKDEYLRKNYDFDYYGSSVKQGYDYILSHDKRPIITICYAHEPVFNNYLMLTEQQKKRIVLVEHGNNYDYYITNFRNHPEDYEFPEIVYTAKVLNSTLVRVYKNR